MKENARNLFQQNHRDVFSINTIYAFKHTEATTITKSAQIGSSTLCKSLLRWLSFVDAENIAGDSLIDILDISDITLPWSKTEDWNAYIFCGNNVKQNTIERPFDSEQKETSAWFINSIYERFYHWPNNIDLILDVGHSKGRKAKVKFTSVEDAEKFIKETLCTRKGHSKWIKEEIKNVNC